jgi:hypothetical protein
MADNQCWTRRPPGSTWGDWGPAAGARHLGVQNMAEPCMQGRGAMAC